MPVDASDGVRRLQLCKILLVAWLPLFVWSNSAGIAGSTIASGLQLLALLAFVTIHASLALGGRGAAAFLLIGYAVGFAMEATSIRYGLPFGYFEHLAPGPKPFGVPLYVPASYAFLGWLAWTIACVLARRHPAEAGGRGSWAVPLLGALILTGYDLAYDAIGSTVKGMWAYRHPGGFFGVPVSNFLGWLVTGWTIFAILARIEPRLARGGTAAVRLPAYWLMPCLVWGAMVLQYPLLQGAASGGEVLVSGRRFVIADIHAAATIVAVLAMLPPALAGAIRALLVAPMPDRDALG